MPLNEIEKISQEIKRKVKLSAIFSLSLIVLIALVVFTVGIIIMSIVDSVGISPNVYVVLGISETVLFCVCFFINYSVKNEKTDPYVISGFSYDYSELAAELKNVLNSDECDENEEGFFGLIKGEITIKLFLFRLPDYDGDRFKKLRKKKASDVNKRYKSKTELTLSEMGKIVRVNLLLLDSWSDQAAKDMQINAAYDMNYAESKLNVFADLSDNKLYIPKYVGLHFGNIKKYYYCVSKLLNEVLS